jgi:AcrR family transcriptional regulator
MMERAEIESEAHSLSLARSVRRYRIIQCATEAFLSKGYAATVMEDIANAAGVGKPTIYKFFDDKYGLATAVLKSLADDLEKTCQTAIDMDANPEECLVKLGDTYILWMLRIIGKTRYYAVVRLLLEMAGPYPQFVQLWRDKRNKALFFPLSNYIKKQIDAGVMIGDDPHFIAAQFIGSVYHAVNSVAAENDFNSNVALTRRKVQLFLRGCTLPTDRSPLGSA